MTQYYLERRIKDTGVTDRFGRRYEIHSDRIRKIGVRYRFLQWLLHSKALIHYLQIMQHSYRQHREGFLRQAQVLDLD